MAEPGQPAFGAFGKMPSLGDFFRIGLGADAVSHWDLWLQALLREAEAALGARYQDCYMSAPVWRFALAPGVAGASGLIGVLMPSVDRVGRSCPLTLMAETGLETASPLRSLFAAGDALGALETLALDCLDDAMTRDALAVRLATISLGPAAHPGLVTQGGGTLRVASARADLLCADLALDLAAGGLLRASAFATELDGTARLMLAEGLPRGAAGIALFDPGTEGGL